MRIFVIWAILKYYLDWQKKERGGAGKKKALREAGLL
jgi:hypothetical protein